MRIYCGDPPHIPYVSVKTCHYKPPVLSCQVTDGHMLVKRKGHRFIYPLSQPRQPWRLPLRRGTVMIIERFHHSLFKMNKCLRSYADSKTWKNWTVQNFTIIHGERHAWRSHSVYKKPCVLSSPVSTCSQQWSHVLFFSLMLLLCPLVQSLACHKAI